MFRVLTSSTLALLAAPASAQVLDLLPTPPAGEITVRLTTITDQLTAPLDGPFEGREAFLPVDFAEFPDGSGRFAVLTLGGLVRLIDASGTLAPVPYLDVLTDDTDITSPQNYGIISLAFHPDFAAQGAPGFGKLYIIETEFATAGTPDFDGSLVQTAFGGNHHDVLYEYTASDITSDVFAGTRREVLRIEQPGFDHNLFDMTFGITPEDAGLLYLSSGDGANAAQQVAQIRQNAVFLGNVFGKVLRIDPLGTDSANGQYGVPASNPFVGVPDALPEIYSYGHRAPYRLNVDRQTGELWVGEVGQRQVEEVNRVTAGANYGWPTKEGSTLFFETNHSGNLPDVDADNNGTGDTADALGLTDPIFEVDHQTSLSITGGFVYRGTAIPALQGRYVFGGAVPSFTGGLGLYHADPADGPVAGDTGGVVEFVLDPDNADTPVRSVFSIGEDLDGELYLLGQIGSSGVLQRLEPVPNPCPVDINDDGLVNILDVVAFISLWNTGGPAGDFNSDGTVNILDVVAYITVWQDGCP
jgi:hypothetical protein